ncbi:MAG: hypothetical protein ACTSWQ_04920 [Candidatus Thorarchaeota archaeon]
MDSDTLLEAMKMVESGIVEEGGDHLDITQDREYPSMNYHRLHIVDMLRNNKVKSSIYVSAIAFKPSQEEIDIATYEALSK